MKRYCIPILALCCLASCGNQAAKTAFEAFEACQPVMLAAKSLADIPCLALPDELLASKYFDEASFLEQWQQLAQSRWQFARGTVEQDLATLRILDPSRPEITSGLSVKMIRQDGAWLVSRSSVSIVDRSSAAASGTGTLRLSKPKKVRSDHVLLAVTSVDNTVAYAFHDRWGEAAVVIQTKNGPLRRGKTEYSYRREAFSDPPVDTTIRLGIYDEDQFSYVHGGVIDVKANVDGFLSGTFDLWAEQRGGDRVEVAGTFEGMAENGPNLFGG